MHQLLRLLPSGGYFFEVEYTAAVKGLPHSKQLAFNRDVIIRKMGTSFVIETRRPVVSACASDGAAGS